MKRLLWLIVLLPGIAWAQDTKAPPQVRNLVLAYQQVGAAIETLSAYYEARIEELKRACGEPCKDK